MDGSGTQADPYHIRSIADLELLSGNGYASYIGTGVYFSLETNLDFAGASFTPIGDDDNLFNGKFCGNNHTISNMIMTTDAGYCGFFCYLTASAEVRDLTFRNCSITDTSTDGYVGLVVGRVFRSTRVTLSNIETDNCEVIASGPDVGGIAGQISRYPALASGNRTLVYNCFVHDGYITGTKNVGGITGYGAGGVSSASSLHELSFQKCVVARELLNGSTSSAEDYVGGILGYMGSYNTNINFTDCKVWACILKGNGYAMGGLFAFAGSTCTTTVTNCIVDNSLVYSSGRVAGGLIGWVHNTSVVTITDCTVTRCTIRGSQQVGGLIGRLNESATLVTYTITNPTITHNCICGNSTSTSVGGVIGYDVAAS